jgi:hypothetical protein
MSGRAGLSITRTKVASRSSERWLPPGKKFTIRRWRTCMPKPKAAIPKRLLKAYIPMDLHGRLLLELVSEVEGRIPLGKISQFTEARFREHFEWKSLDLRLYGGPEGFFIRGPAAMIDWLSKRLPASLQNPLAALGEASHAMTRTEYGPKP